MSSTDRNGRVAYLNALCKTVPYHLVEEVLANPTEQAIRNQVFPGSIMFCDVVGFTAMCERLAQGGKEGLSELSQLLDELFGSLIENAIFPCGGYVVQFGGDSVTVFFRGEDHAWRCAAAALTAQRMMHGESGRLLGGKSGELMLRIGIASGQVELPVLGDSTRRAVVCAGATAHRALELQRLAPPNGVVADHALIALAGPALEVVDRHPDRAVVRGLRRWPTPLGKEPLGPRIREQVEEKIGLLEPFVAQPLAQRLRKTPLGWRVEGELLNLVILFTEIWGLDEATRDVEVARDVARSILRAYRRYGGVVSKADIADRGHRVLVIFGLQDASDNDCERAVLAALEATSRVRGLTASHSSNIVMRTGVHWGRVFYGAVGSDTRHDITVLGDTVNTAARLGSAAGAFEVFATQELLERAPGAFTHSDRGPVRVKGKGEPLRMHAVHGPSEGRSHFVRPRAKPRFCAGRGAETGLLLSLAEEARGGRGKLIALCGDGGVGKSFLLSRLVDAWVAAGGQGVVGRCRYATKSVPLAPVVTMFENFLGISAHDPEDVRRERIRTSFAGFELGDGAPELIALLEPVRRADGTTEALVDLSDNHSRERVLASITRFLQQRVQRDALLYIVEDMQFADTLTIALAQRLPLLQREHPFMFVATYRPEAHLRDLRRVVDVEIELKNLGLTETAQLVEHARGTRAVDPELSLFLWQRTNGNPGYMEELLRFLAERDLLGARGGVAVSKVALGELDHIVPESLAHVALAGLSQLGEVERRVLRAAAAIGRRFDRGLLESVANVGGEADLLDGAVLNLQQERVITPDQTADAAFVFRDDVTRAVTYGTIPESERREVHRRIADALEHLDPSEPARSPVTLALHRERSGELVEAARWYERAARLSMKGSLDRETGVLVESWQRVVDQLAPVQRPSAETRARLHLLRFVSTARQGMAAETFRLARDMTGELWEALDASARLVVDFWLGSALVRLGRPERARERFERVFKESGRGGLRGDGARELALSSCHADDEAGATLWLHNAAVAAADDEYRAARVELVRARLDALMGRTEEARARLDVLLGAARRRDHLFVVAACTHELAFCDMADRALDDACAGFERAASLARGAGSWGAEAEALVRLGEAHLWSGRADESIAHFDKAVAVARELGDELVMVRALVGSGAALALVRDPVEGRALCEDGYRRAARAGLREAEVTAELHLLRLALLARDKARIQGALAQCRTTAAHRRTELHLAAMAELTALATELAAAKP